MSELKKNSGQPLHKLTIWLNGDDVAKLEALAAARSKDAKRKVTIGDCLRGFIRSCQPGGGWTHPQQTKPSDGEANS